MENSQTYGIVRLCRQSRNKKGYEQGSGDCIAGHNSDRGEDNGLQLRRIRIATRTTILGMGMGNGGDDSIKV